MSLNLADLFEAVVDKLPDRTALVCGDERRTFSQLDQRANLLAHHLAQRGVQVGEHVGIHMRNSTQFVEALLACLKIRAVPVNINYRYTEDELTYLYNNSQIVSLIVDGEFVPIIAGALPACPGIKDVLVFGSVDDPTSISLPLNDFDDAMRTQSADRDFGPRSDDDRFVIYTGGTTGMPKGVVWRHVDFFMAALAGGNHGGAAFTNTADLADAVAANSHPMAFLLPAPLMHGAAVYSVFSGFFSGAKQVLMRSFEPVEALRLIQDEQLSCVTVVGDAMARPFTDAIARHGSDYDLTSLTLVSSGGALWSRSSKNQLLELMPNLFLRDGFGASESGVDGTLEIDADGNMRVVGNPNMLVVDEELRPIEPGSDMLGYIARVGHVPLGYFNEPEKTAETFPVVDGVRMSILGDMGRVEPDGSIVLLGRGSVCINTGGEKVFPEEVEAAIKSHHAVMDAVVAGTPNALFGEQVSAVVQLREDFEDIDTDEIAEHCRASIAGYKIPRSIVVVPAIVRSPAGKADYRWARATVAEVVGA
ncbi:acyl-CoA synthetase [Rhodococcus sp. AD45-ID]|uniref:acyl-CoA synthetase n=1 Tax=unclassified Rhodococcus (in: high G+C Gram-positive bacteria) TaxID=192944 RepID=UPI0005D4586A|nr:MULTISPECIES: acyl-CoA synthetase [unclassified Rhodococcus (in: high G+C Gram-positive bacteria)]KJF22669.1 Long-chain-fatty-acid--CoA ligase FadD19 [Rhodococcus sp. AD45]NRI64460.1 acyl-CoA synthetase [Rhodococcus sp. MS16]PSR40253.1 acyl-CoA synthetase [Rhodococcus sp. AD45-ID]